MTTATVDIKKLEKNLKKVIRDNGMRLDKCSGKMERSWSATVEIGGLAKIANALPGWSAKRFTAHRPGGSWAVSKAVGQVFTAPSGAEFTSNPWEVSLDETEKFLFGHGFKAACQALLNGEVQPEAPAAPKLGADGRLTCGCCLKPFKVTAKGTLARHGYKRPGTGYEFGHCMGGQRLPFEVSDAVSREMVEFLKGYRKRQKALLAQLKKSPPKSYQETRKEYVRGRYEEVTKTYNKKSTKKDSWDRRREQEDWKRCYNRDVRATTRNIEMAEKDLETFAKLLKDYKPSLTREQAIALRK